MGRKSNYSESYKREAVVKAQASGNISQTARLVNSFYRRGNRILRRLHSVTKSAILPVFTCFTGDTFHLAAVLHFELTIVVSELYQ
jgi:hypothetical protein